MLPLETSVGFTLLCETTQHATGIGTQTRHFGSCP